MARAANVHGECGLGVEVGQSSSSIFDDVKTCALWAPDDRADDSSFFVFFLCNSPQIQSGSKGLLRYPRSRLKRLSVRDYGLSSMNFKSASKEKQVH